MRLAMNATATMPADRASEARRGRCLPQSRSLIGAPGRGQVGHASAMSGAVSRLPFKVGPAKDTVA